MLIYNHEKELIGIDARDLNTLGFKNLAQLKAEVSDFANLFVKKAGFIHNFEHVHWIDFVHTASDVDTISEVIIKTKEKQFQATLQIESIYLNDEPSLPAFIVYLQGLEDLDADLKDEDDAIVDETFISEDTNIVENIEIEKDEEDLEDLEKNEEFNVEKTTIKKDKIQDEEYLYNPLIASQELGLSIDVVEEFIQDFIKQAKEFKSLLYTSLENDDIKNVQTLSHKLKGVSANLRIDNIFEILNNIKNSNDKDFIKQSLDEIYEKIDELSLNSKKPINSVNNLSKAIEGSIEIEELSNDIFLDTQHPDIDESQKLENEPEKLFETIEIMYDKNSVADELGISYKNFEELFYDFTIEAKILSDAIHDAILEDNKDSWIVEAIKFKGISRNMHLYECVNELDKIIQTDDKDIVQTSINIIDSAIKNISNV